MSLINVRENIVLDIFKHLYVIWLFLKLNYSSSTPLIYNNGVWSWRGSWFYNEFKLSFEKYARFALSLLVISETGYLQTLPFNDLIVFGVLLVVFTILN